MISFDDYKRPDGRIDWKAYHAAETAAGQKCMHCGAFIYPARGRPTKCPECSSIEASPELRHSSRIRCPSCREDWNVSDMESPSLFGDGEHAVSCPECGATFEITTHVEFTFVSPKIPD